MLISRPPVRVFARPLRKRSGTSRLRRDLHDDRDLIDTTQRAVARGRQTVVRARCRVLRFRHAALDRTDLSPRAQALVIARLARLIAGVDRAHDRLLRLSATVEKENDRLEIALAEIERLADLGESRGERR
jgi:hypothetical protein